MSAHLEPTLSPPMLADVLAFEALPEDVQELARRVLLHGAPDPATQEALIDAYKRGFEDAASEMEPPLTPRRAEIIERLKD